MRAIVQRVMKASVTVGDELVSSIGQGICVLVGISRDDNRKDLEWLARKILNLRVFEDDQQKTWAKSVVDMKYEILCVSQFTLYSVLKGNKPDFHCSMGGDESTKFYEDFLAEIRKSYQPDLIKDGQFGAHMQVNIQNDGPVTISLESPVQNIKPDKRMQKSDKPTNKGKSKKSDCSSDTSACAASDKTDTDAACSEAGPSSTEEVSALAESVQKL